MNTDIINQITQGGIAFTVLLAAILYFLKREKKKEKEIENLNQILREVEKENLTALYKVLGYLEKSTQKDTERFNQLKSDIDLMRQSIEDKINNLK